MHMLRSSSAYAYASRSGAARDHPSAALHQPRDDEVRDWCRAAMPLLSNEAFLSKLAKLYQSHRSKGKVTLTIKRARPSADGADKCLVRAAANDMKSKISTQIAAKDHVKFQTEFAKIAKAQWSALNKRSSGGRRRANTRSRAKSRSAA